MIEECGLKGELTLIEKVYVSYHTYVQQKNKILKETHWFLMDYRGDEIAIPQIKEGITEVCWKSLEGQISLQLYHILLFQRFGIPILFNLLHQYLIGVFLSISFGIKKSNINTLIIIHWTWRICWILKNFIIWF